MMADVTVYGMGGRDILAPIDCLLMIVCVFSVESGDGITSWSLGNGSVVEFVDQWHLP